MKHITKRIQTVWMVFYHAFLRFLEDDGFALSSHIALASFTALFPFWIFLASLARFLRSKDLARRATDALFAAWPEALSAPSTHELHSLFKSNASTVTFGVILSIYFSSSAVDALRIGLNRAYGMRETRSWLSLKIESIAYVFVAAFTLLAIGLLLLLGPMIWNWLVGIFPYLFAANYIFNIYRYVVVVALLALSLVIAHKFIAAGNRPLYSVWVGIVLTLVLSLIFVECFGAYINVAAQNYVATYAGLASAIIGLAFLYCLAVIFIFGAELNTSIAVAQKLLAIKNEREQQMRLLREHPLHEET